MQLNNSEAALYEVDLYNDLLAFTDLSPDQQRAEIEWLASSGVSITSSSADESISSGAAVEEASAPPAASGPLHITGHLSDKYLPPSGAGQMTCSACGSKSPGHDLFCIACGHFMD